MNKLNKEEIEFITKCLNVGKPLPDSYRYILPFETKKEYELTYEGKEREEDILADTMAVPLQPVKTFGNGNDSWTNKLIFGDNLQVLKALMDVSEVYDKNTGRGKVKLIYIDPPFGTGDIYDAKGDSPAYSAKLQGAKFIEFLRKRIVFLREILVDDGSIYVRIDYHFGHYIKNIMDEIFEKNNFQNEIIINRFQKKSNTYTTTTESLFFYSKNPRFVFNRIERPRQCTFCKQTIEPKWHTMTSPGEGKPSIICGKKLYPQKGRHWTYNQENIIRMEKEGRIRINTNLSYTDTQGEKITGVPEYLESKERVIDSNWTDIPGYKFGAEYPTENSEEILERIIKASSNPDDLILDSFAGSGTTGAVAEKLGRRWIMIDCGKLAIYTMQKRLLNLREEIGNSGKPLKPKPFTLYNAGLYDYKMVKDLPWEKYREFVLKLFQCRDEKHRIAGVELDGYLGEDNVMVFNYQKHKDVILDRGFIDDLHKILGDKIGYKFFIIAPAASVMFFEDYIEKPRQSRGKVQTKYFALRIPYSIIDELHRKGFTHIIQPIREADVNATIDAVGFDFIRTPDVECKYYINKTDEELFDKAIIRIIKFTSTILSKKPIKFENRETLSMVMVDYDYDGKVFDFDDVFYADDIKKQDWEVRFDVNKIGTKIMIIYIDIFGNEKREVKSLKDFRR